MLFRAGTLLTEHGVRHCLSMLVVPAPSYLTLAWFASLMDQGGALENAALLDNGVAVARSLLRCWSITADGWLVNIEAPLPGGLGM